MAQQDRTAFIGNTGIKKPVKVATTASIVLSGEQTIDGVACVSGDRVLVKDQATGSENGIYDVDTGAWTRSRDFDGVYNVVRGTMVRVNQGSTHADGIFAVTTPDTITLGTTSLAFSRIGINYIVAEAQVAAAGQTIFNLGTSFQTGSNGIAVYVNGARVYGDYTETSATRITFANPLQLNDEVVFFIGQAVGSLTAASAVLVAITDAGDFFLATTVEAALQEVIDNIAVDNGDADAAFVNVASARVQRWNTPLTANRTLTLSVANAKEGAHCTAVRGSGATGNFTLTVGALATLRAPGEWARCVYDAGTAAWVLEASGTLPSAEVLGMTVDNGDASVNVTVGTSLRTQRWATVLTADRTATLQAAGAYTGARVRLVRDLTATGNFSLIVSDGTTSFARLAPGQTAEMEHTGAAWKLMGVRDHIIPNTNLVRLLDDFLGEEVDGFRWQSLIGTDAACRQATVLVDQAGGVARLTTGAGAGATMAANGVETHSQLNWKANKAGLVYEARVAIDVITNVAVFLGLTDQRAALEMPFTLGAGDALTSNASDAVGVLFDTAADTDNWWLVGVKADIDAAKQNTAVAPVAGTFETWKIEVDTTGVATFYRNGVLIGAVMLGAITASVLLTPVIATFSRTNASRNIDVDHVLVQAQR